MPCTLEIIVQGCTTTYVENVVFLTNLGMFFFVLRYYFLKYPFYNSPLFYRKVYQSLYSGWRQFSTVTYCTSSADVYCSCNNTVSYLCQFNFSPETAPQTIVTWTILWHGLIHPYIIVHMRSRITDVYAVRSAYIYYCMGNLSMLFCGQAWLYERRLDVGLNMSSICIWGWGACLYFFDKAIVLICLFYCSAIQWLYRANILAL